MYLSHLDSGTHKPIADTLRSTIAITTAPLPMKYRVPGLATTITHQLQNTPLNGPAVQTSDGYCHECSDDDEDTDAVVNFSNDRRRPQYSRNNNTNMSKRQPYTPKWSSSPKQTKAAYKGSCHCCGRDGHHSNECYFLMKVEQCLAYLNKNPKAGVEKAAKYRQQSRANYQNRRAKINHLMETNFLPYKDVDPDAFLDCLDDNILNEAEEIFIQ